MSGFGGFRPEALRFLEELSRNNDRAWFDEHRAEYEEHLLEPARDFVDDLGHRLRRLSPGVHFEPRVNGSIFRINRDTRFSRDKRPYKDHLDLWLWQGRDRKESPGFWFRLAPDRVVLGVGKHSFDPPLLNRYRQAVLDGRRGPALERAVARVRAAGYDVHGQSYKRVPRGLPADHRRANLLRHGSLYASIELTPAPPEVHTPGFSAFCVQHYRRMKPLQDWVAELVG